jgi:hypothetical protein
MEDADAYKSTARRAPMKTRSGSVLKKPSPQTPLPHGEGLSELLCSLREKGTGVEGQEAKQDFFDTL